jgi:hypothetical protein
MAAGAPLLQPVVPQAGPVVVVAVERPQPDAHLLCQVPSRSDARREEAAQAHGLV